MEPIISPWTVYFINLMPNITQMLNIIQCICVVAAVGSIILRCLCTDDSWETREQHERNAVLRQQYWIITKLSIPIGLVALTINTFIPSRDTMIAMIIANYITPDNLHGANEAIKTNLQDYINMIVDGINKVK